MNIIYLGVHKKNVSKMKLYKIFKRITIGIDTHKVKVDYKEYPIDDLFSEYTAEMYEPKPGDKSDHIGTMQVTTHNMEKKMGLNTGKHKVDVRRMKG